MALPASFTQQGFLTASQTSRRIIKGVPSKSPLRRLLIGCEGPTQSGKTEFCLSAPGPGLMLCLDRGFDGCLDNPEPPASRKDHFAFKVIDYPVISTNERMSETKQKNYVEYFNNFYKVYVECVENPDARTVIIDGDGDSYELQRVAELGALKQIPPLAYDNLNASRRAMYARAWDAGKILITTNKVKQEWSTAYNADGSPKLSRDGKEVREWDGKSYKRQGFPDQDYLWHIQLRMFREKDVWGAKIMKCKANPKIEGFELRGDECNFESLVAYCYPDVPSSEWGL